MLQTNNTNANMTQLIASELHTNTLTNGLHESTNTSGRIILIILKCFFLHLCKIIYNISTKQFKSYEKNIFINALRYLLYPRFCSG